MLNFTLNPNLRSDFERSERLDRTGRIKFVIRIQPACYWLLEQSFHPLEKKIAYDVGTSWRSELTRTLRMWFPPLWLGARSTLATGSGRWRSNLDASWLVPGSSCRRGCTCPARDPLFLEFRMHWKARNGVRLAWFSSYVSIFNLWYQLKKGVSYNAFRINQRLIAH